MMAFRSVARSNSVRCRHATRSSYWRRFLSNGASKPASNMNLATKTEIESLRAEIRTLQKELLENNQVSIQRLQQEMEKRSHEQYARLEKIHEHITSGSTLNQVSSAVTDYVKHNEALVGILQQLQKSRSYQYLNKKTLGALVAVLLIVWTYRAKFKQRTSEEVASIASQTLQQETLRETIQETLNALATSPDTLATLNNLLQTVIREPATVDELTKLVVYVLQTQSIQKSLMELLQVVFEHPHLQQLAGEFLLKGLDVDSVKKMLESQTQDLVKQTVSDPSVQKATGTGIQKALWYAVTPNILQNSNNGNHKGVKKEKSDVKHDQEAKQEEHKQEQPAQ